MDKFLSLTSELYRYLVGHCSPRPPVLDELARETQALGSISIMQIAPEQGALLTLLVRVANVRSAVEVGTFTGYSSLCIALGLPLEGRLLCCDVNAEWTTIARRYWEKAGVANRIELRLAPALDTLRTLPKSPSIDFSFIDADKANYRAYYEELLPRTRQNGLIVFDNVLWGGTVVDPVQRGEEVEALRQLNDWLAQDPRVEVVMLPIADGLTLARKK